MDGENNGKPYYSMDDLGGKPHYFRKHPNESLGSNDFQLPAAAWSGSRRWLDVFSFCVVMYSTGRIRKKSPLKTKERLTL